MYKLLIVILLCFRVDFALTQVPSDFGSPLVFTAVSCSDSGFWGVSALANPSGFYSGSNASVALFQQRFLSIKGLSQSAVEFTSGNSMPVSVAIIQAGIKEYKRQYFFSGTRLRLTDGVAAGIQAGFVAELAEGYKTGFYPLMAGGITWKLSEMFIAGFAFGSFAMQGNHSKFQAGPNSVFNAGFEYRLGHGLAALVDLNRRSGYRMASKYGIRYSLPGCNEIRVVYRFNPLLIAIGFCHGQSKMAYTFSTSFQENSGYQAQCGLRFGLSGKSSWK